MIKAEELRIGNYLQDTLHKQPVRVVNINRTTIRVCFDNELEEQLLSCQDLEPIPLTEEILLKCGFVSNAYKDPAGVKSSNFHVKLVKTFEKVKSNK